MSDVEEASWRAGGHVVVIAPEGGPEGAAACNVLVAKLRALIIFDPEVGKKTVVAV